MRHNGLQSPQWRTHAAVAVLSVTLLLGSATVALAEEGGGAPTTPGSTGGPTETAATTATPTDPTPTGPTAEPTTSTEGPTSTSSEPTPTSTPSASPTATTTASPSPTTPEPVPQGSTPPTPEDGPDASRARLAPQVVPQPPANSSVITVKVGGDRVGTNQVSELAGVQLGLYANQTGGSAVFTCTSDVDGDCNFTIPNTQTGGANRDRRFWVRQISAPGGWFMNPTLRTGSSSASQSEQTAYTFQTGTQLRDGQTYRSTVDFMIGTGDNNRVASGGVWQQSRTNPTLPPSCGLDVALILDLSGSVGGDLPNLKQAANTFVDSLVGTPSRMSIFSFSDDSPANQAGQNYPTLFSVSTTAGANQVKSLYANWGSNGGTNWDRGIAAAAAAAPLYDIAVIITDGNPTRYSSPPQGPGSFNRFREVENGIFSANALKAPGQGTRIIAFGVGAGAVGADTALNLRSISGTVAFNGSNGSVADYYQTNDYAAAGNALRALALGNCEGSLSVVKQIVPAGNTGEDITGAVPAGAGWVFDGSTTTPGIGGLPAQKTTTGDGTGSVNFPLTFPGTVTTAPVTVAETQHAGFTLVTQNGQNAVCTNLSATPPQSVPVTNSGSLGFTVDVPSTAAVSCNVYNREAPAQASVEVNKRWVINDVPLAEGQQPTGFLASLTLTGPGGAGATPQEWGEPRPGYQVNDTTTINETVELDRTFCQLSSSRVTEANGTVIDQALPYTPQLTQPANTYTITNTVTCQTYLSLDKLVFGGLIADRDPDAWTLSAIGPAQALPGPTGQRRTPETTQVPVTPRVTYQLAETGGDPRFIQDDERTNNDNPLSTGSMNCEELDANGDVIPGFADGLNGGVTVPLGAWVRCTAINRAATLHLRKVVINDNGGTAVPSDWDLTATPINNPPPGIGPETVTGSDALLGVGFTVRPNVDYQVTESDVPGYVQDSFGCVFVPRQGPTNVVNLDPEDIVICTFTNVDQPAHLTLVKVVDNGTTGGTAVPSDWTLSADGPTPVTGDGNSPEVTDQPVNAGTYDLSEANGPAGYDASPWECVGGAQSGASVDISVGDDVTCTITNTAQQAHLTLVKEVVNDNGGTAIPGDWTLNADGPTPVSGPGNSQQVTNQSVDPGSYDLSETNGPPGYAASDWVCDGGMQSGASVDVALGDDVTCTITNDDQAALLTLVKVVDNGTTGGTAEPADWQLTADGPTPVSGDGNSPEVTDQPVDAGTYDLSEANGPAGYAASDWSCEGGTQNGASVDIAVGDDVTCTITNTAQQAHLTLVKEVVNDNGGTATPEQWTLTADGPTPVSGDGNSPEVTGQPVDPGSYDLSESGGPAGYAASDWSCDGGTQNGASVDIALGDDVTCTIINDDEIAHLTLVKVVVNDNGGTAVDTDWTLSADGPTPITGTTGDPAVTDAVVDAGDYALTEDGPSGYAASDWVCDGGDLTGGTVTVPNGGDVTCTITNDDQQAQLTLVKVVDNGNTGGTAVPSDWTLSADGPTPVSGAGNSAEVTDQPVDAGSYDLSEADGPDGYTASAWECVGGSQSGASVDIAVGDDVTCTITNTAQPSRWTLEKTSDPQSPSTVNPGDEITYTITASKLGGVDPTGVVVTDDLSSVLDNATLVAGSIDPSTGTATQNGNQIVWDIGTLSGDETLSYRVRVNDGAYGVQLRNVASGTAVTPPEECPAPAELRPVARAFIAARRAATWSAIANPKAAAEDPCSTVHRTPKWTLSKASDPTSGSTIDPGSVVTYTLTATNVSDAEVNHAVVHDDLSNVLNHATLIAVPAGATLNGTTLTWNVPPMPANGDQETLTYSVRIDADAADVTIGNVATPGAGGSCVTACETTHKTPATLPTQTENPPPPPPPGTGPLVNTGGPSEALVWAGLLLLLVGGGGIYFATRRRRSDHAG